MRDLVQGKREWSSPISQEDVERGFLGWHENGYLPHRDEPGLVQFVTFRLEDSFPTALRSEWEALKQIEDERERRKELDAYLDKGRGACLLRHADLAAMVEGALRFFHGQRYDLRAWVVMPNHVHTLFKVDATPMSQIVESWKKFTCNRANELLGRSGSLWAEDYWDTFMRDAAHELKARRYIENNPAKAFLVRDPKAWPWSSARFRDEHGVLPP